MKRRWGILNESQQFLNLLLQKITPEQDFLIFSDFYPTGIFYDWPRHSCKRGKKNAACQKPAQEMKELKPKNLNELIKFLLILPLQGAIYFHGKNSVRKVCSRIPKITKAEAVPHFHKWGTASAFLMTQYPSLPTQCFDCTNSDTPSYCNSET